MALPCPGPLLPQCLSSCPVPEVSADIRKSPCVASSALPPLWSFDHCAHTLWIERLAARVAIARLFEPGADLTVAQSAGFAFRPSKATRFRNHLWPQLSVSPPAARPLVTSLNVQGAGRSVLLGRCCCSPSTVLYTTKRPTRSEVRSSQSSCARSASKP